MPEDKAKQPLESIDVSISSDFFKKNFAKLVEDQSSADKQPASSNLDESVVHMLPANVVTSPMKSLLTGVNKKAQLGKYSSSSAYSVSENQSSFEARKRETEVAFSVMKSKLLNMGIPLKGESMNQNQDSNNSSEVAASTAVNAEPSIHSQKVTKKLKTDHSVVFEGSVTMESLTKPPLGASKVGLSFESKQSSSRLQQFQEEEYINDAGVSDSIAVNVDENDAHLGRNVHNNSILTDDSAECNHVFDLDSSDEFSIINQPEEQATDDSKAVEAHPIQSESEIKAKLEQCKATMK